MLTSSTNSPAACLHQTQVYCYPPCYVIRLSALYTCFIIQYTSCDSWPCSDWPLASNNYNSQLSIMSRSACSISLLLLARASHAYSPIPSHPPFLKIKQTQKQYENVKAMKIQSQWSLQSSSGDVVGESGRTPDSAARLCHLRRRRRGDGWRRRLRLPAPSTPLPDALAAASVG